MAKGKGMTRKEELQKEIEEAQKLLPTLNGWLYTNILLDKIHKLTIELGKIEAEEHRKTKG